MQTETGTDYGKGLHEGPSFRVPGCCTPCGSLYSEEEDLWCNLRL